MSFREMLNKTTIANVVAGVVVVGGFIYGCLTNNAQLVSVITGGGLGYLYGKAVA